MSPFSMIRFSKYSPGCTKTVSPAVAESIPTWIVGYCGEGTSMIPAKEIFTKT